jgi:hypothetical protein
MDHYEVLISIYAISIFPDEVIEEARKIIYLGASSSHAWWDTVQLLMQMKDIIRIFEAAHPNHQALFIFDQSSAHASLPEDAL